MTSTKREQVLQALFSLLKSVPGVEVLRDVPFPVGGQKINAIVLYDGNPGEPETLLSPLSYLWYHRAVVEVGVQHPDPAERAMRLDALAQAIDNLLREDPTLGGLCDRADAMEPVIGLREIEGAPDLKFLSVDIELTYQTTSRLG